MRSASNGSLRPPRRFLLTGGDVAWKATRIDDPDYRSLATRCVDPASDIRTMSSDERRDEVDVGLDGFQHLGLEEHSLEVEPLERVLLHNANDRRREVRSDVAQPSRNGRCRASETATPVRPGRAGHATTTRSAVERLERAIHPCVRPAERRACGLLGIVAEHETPPACAFGVGGISG